MSLAAFGVYMQNYPHETLYSQIDSEVFVNLLKLSKSFRDVSESQWTGSLTLFC